MSFCHFLQLVYYFLKFASTFAVQFFQRTHIPPCNVITLLVKLFCKTHRALVNMGGAGVLYSQLLDQWEEVHCEGKFYTGQSLEPLQTLHTGRSLLSVVSVTEEASLSTLLVRNVAHCREVVLAIKLPI